MKTPEPDDTRAQAVAWVKNHIDFIVRALVDNEEAVDLGTRYGEQTAVITLKVDPTDLGKVIGKAGRNITAIRTILNSLAAKRKIRMVLDVEDDGKRPVRALSAAKA